MDYNQHMVQMVPFIKRAMELLFIDRAMLPKRGPDNGETPAADIKAVEFVYALRTMEPALVKQLRVSSVPDFNNAQIKLVDQEYMFASMSSSFDLNLLPAPLRRLNVAHYYLWRAYQEFRPQVEMVLDLDDLHQFYVGNVKAKFERTFGTERHLYERHRDSLRRLIANTVQHLGLKNPDIACASDELIDRAWRKAMGELAKALKEDQDHWQRPI